MSESEHRTIFVFGSNLAGRHGKGAALAAVRFHGAVYGQGEGLQGNAYAIPTKGPGARRSLVSLPLEAIRGHVRTFLDFARDQPDLIFEVTAIGCGLAGYTADEIGPMFAGYSANVRLPAEFAAVAPVAEWYRTDSSGKIVHISVILPPRPPEKIRP